MWRWLGLSRYGCTAIGLVAISIFGFMGHVIWIGFCFVGFVLLAGIVGNFFHACLDARTRRCCNCVQNRVNVWFVSAWTRQASARSRRPESRAREDMTVAVYGHQYMVRKST